MAARREARPRGDRQIGPHLDDDLAELRELAHLMRQPEDGRADRVQRFATLGEARRQ